MKTTKIENGLYQINGTNKKVQHFIKTGNGYGNNYDYWTVIYPDGTKSKKHKTKKQAVENCVMSDSIQGSLELAEKDISTSVINSYAIYIFAAGVLAGIALMEIIK